MFKVIDVSRHQGEIDFNKFVEQDVKGVAIRATIGNYYYDERFSENWEGAGNAGLLRTAYHVVKPSHTVTSQMNNFFLTLGTRRPEFGKYGWVMDCELSDGKDMDVCAKVISGCLTAADSHAGKRSYIYTRMSWWNIRVGHTMYWKNWPLWVARYWKYEVPWLPTDPSWAKPRPGEWTDWAIHQYSDSNYLGPVYGVESKDIDLNRAKEYVFDEVPPTQPPPPPPVVEFPVPLRLNIGSSGALNIRTEPRVAYDTLAGQFKGDKAVPTAFEVVNQNGNLAYRIGEKLWIYGKYNGRVYAEPMK